VTTNPIIASGLGNFDAAGRAAVIKAFDPGNTGYIPIIPVCGTAVAEVVAPARATISASRIDEILDSIVGRLRAVTKPLLDSAIGAGLKDLAARMAIDGIISTWGKAKLRDLLQQELKEVIYE
jgi:hypothetical protein